GPAQAGIAAAAEGRAIKEVRSDGSRQQDVSELGRERKVEFGLVSQKELQAEQNGNEGTGWIALRKLGEQGQRASKRRRLVGCQPEVDAPQVAWLAGPCAHDARDRLPSQALVMHMKRHHGQRRAGVQPAGFLGSLGAWRRGAQVKGNDETRDRK